MAQKQKHDSDSNMGTYDALVLRLLHMGQELLGQKHGVFDRFSQEITLATQGKVHLTFNHQHPEQPSPAELAYRFPVQFKERFYGILSIAPEPADSFSPSIALVTASLLAQLCGWLLYAIEVAALMPELGKPYTHAYQARRTLTKRELEALALMCQGHDQQAIAGILHISRHFCPDGFFISVVSVTFTLSGCSSFTYPGGRLGGAARVITPALTG